MLSQQMQDAFNEQIKNEFQSSYLYLAMAAHFEANNLPGFAKWMRIQAQEETSHGMKFFDYIVDRGGRVVLQAVDRPQTEFGSVLSIFEHALEHERWVTGRINHLYQMALGENDYASQVLLQWFVNEQVEEEKSVSLIIEQLKRAGEGGALLFLDRHVGRREEG